MLFGRFSGGRAREAETSGEQELPTWINDPGSAKGDGFSDGRKPPERRRKAEQVLRGSAGVEGSLETGIRSSERRKALEREAQERWELKEASEGFVS